MAATKRLGPKKNVFKTETGASNLFRSDITTFQFPLVYASYRKRTCGQFGYLVMVIIYLGSSRKFLKAKPISFLLLRKKKQRLL